MYYSGHQRAEARNLHLHRAAFAKLRQEPDRAGPCLALAESWLAQPDTSARRWIEQWRDMLANWPIEQIEAVVLDERGGQSLRQCSPLGPLFTPRERWALLDEANRLLTVAAGRAP